jgi:hypothetical protein
MTNEYTVTEVIEIGEAQEVILGQKVGPSTDIRESEVFPDNDIDE